MLFYCISETASLQSEAATVSLVSSQATAAGPGILTGRKARRRMARQVSGQKVRRECLLKRHCIRKKITGSIIREKNITVAVLLPPQSAPFAVAFSVPQLRV
jgi:hypothetical protein